MMKEPVKIRELDSDERINNFNEVVLGYSEEEAFKEASRCLQCKNPACISGCPVGVDIKKFIYQITQKDYQAAYSTIREKNDFPSVCGRVCPAEYQCRMACVLSKKNLPFASREAINIHFLERFVADYGMKHCSSKQEAVNPVRSKAPGATAPPTAGTSNGVSHEFKDKKVAVVGSGPAGLCVAAELARQGIKVVVFESLHKPGGVLRYGIPPFRLSRNILDFEIDYLKKLGVKIVPNFIVGRVKMLDELFSEGYSAIFLGLGAGVPSFLKIKGENLCNVYSANEFLTRVNLMCAYKFPQFHTPVNTGKNIIVIGGGNTAMDAARVALRLQKINGITANVTILYRRSEVEMPARRPEIEHAKEEGVGFKFLVQPKELTGDKNGYVRKIRCLQCRLGEPDSSGRRRPIPIEGSDFEIECDLVIIAVGLKANKLLTSVTPDLKVDKYADLVVSPDTMETSIKGVYAGGDIVGGEGTVIEAMGMAKKASRAIIKYLCRD
ncbi:MAG: NADPH-dependent glutamate synthase [Candidatus Omnitrophica bacterium]|nr:NADPH-dependent glutamate synthase [Candidatus Omnitrophota bacterium]